MAAGGCYEVHLAGKVLARSSRCEVANRRLYFPPEDVRISLLRPSGKLWR